MVKKLPRRVRICAGYSLAQIVILVIIYWPWLSGQACYYHRDMPHYIEPFCKWVGESLRQGKFPLWNPWEYCGMSQIAISIHNPLYPPTWFFAVLPFSAAVAANMIFQQWLAGLGGLLLALKLRWGLVPAFACGFILAMSGYMFSLVSNFSVPATCSWGPLCLWAIWSLSRRTPDASTQAVGVARWRFVLAAVCIAMLVEAGQPEMVAINLGLLGLFTLAAAVRHRPGMLDFSWRLRAILAGVFLAMPLILPSVEWLALSRRASGLLPGEVLILSANWYDMLCLLLPQPLGDLQLRWSEFRELVMQGALVPYVPAAFVGPIALTLAMIGVADKTWRYRFWLAGLLLFVLLVALGANGFILPAVLKVFPSFSLARFPVKLLFFAVWCLALLAARGIKQLSTGQALALDPAIVWLACLLLGGGLTLHAIPADMLVSIAGLPIDSAVLASKAGDLIGPQLCAAAMIGLVMSAAAGSLRRGKKQAARGAGFVVLAFLCGSLAFYALECCRNTTSPSFYDQPSSIAKLVDDYRSHGVGQPRWQAEDAPGPRGQRTIGLYMDHFSVPLGLMSKEPLPATVQMYQYSRQVLRPNTNVDFKELSAFGFEGTTPGDYYYFVLNSYLKSSQAFANPDSGARSDAAIARLCQLTATDYVLTQVERYADDGKPVASLKPDPKYFHLCSEDGSLNVGIYRVNDTLPRAYFTDCWQWVDSAPAVIQLMFDPEKSGFNPFEKTLLLKAAGVPAPASDPVMSCRSQDNTVKLLNDSNESVTISVDAQRPGYVVLADQNYPGWTAELDGKPTPIVVANGFTRAVAIPTTGQHKVIFAYQPQSFYTGCWIALVGILWMIVVLRKRRPQ